MMKYLTRTVWLLSILSLLNDISSEMLYPVLPLFLQSVGFSVAMIGLMEGLGDVIGGVGKGYFGAMSDAMGRRLPFVQTGYLLSALSKLAMSIFSFPLWIFSARTADKVGKSIRTAARDSMLSDESTLQNKGKVFGFHRGMDTLGAAIGPMVALVLMYYYPGRYQLFFLIAFMPAMVGLALTFMMREKKSQPDQSKDYHFGIVFTYFKNANSDYRKVVWGILLFSLFNSSDLFLLMKIKETVSDERYVIGAYMFYNVIYALASFPLGALGDRIGLRKTYIAGLLIFAGVYLLMALGHSLIFFVVAFVLYGIYSAATDGISKALITTLAPIGETGAAVGSMSGLSALAVAISSTGTGLVWSYFSGEVALLMSACGTLIAAVYMMSVRTNTPIIKTGA
jgi:MFS family permease